MQFLKPVRLDYYSGYIKLRKLTKVGVIGMTRAIALEEQKKGSKTSINSCCPGWVKTDMTKGKGSKTPDQGAETPVLLALGNIKGQTGLFWEDEKPIEW